VLFAAVATDMTFDGIVVPGGPGHKNIGECEPLLKLLGAYTKAPGKTVAAICAAPVYLGRVGILADKRATCYPSMAGDLRCKERREEEVVVDGNIITSRGPGTAMAFSLALLERFVGKATRDQIQAGTVYMH
jgi:4-methyl-5(b-hydroxyethyl)-thiazole monophosphate biosynthesis